MLYVQKVKLNLAEQYRKNLPIGQVLSVCFKETMKPVFLIKTIILRVKSLIS